jgi:predicted NACHT family NTPase
LPSDPYELYAQAVDGTLARYVSTGPSFTSEAGSADELTRMLRCIAVDNQRYRRHEFSDADVEKALAPGKLVPHHPGGAIVPSRDLFSLWRKLVDDGHGVPLVKCLVAASAGMDGTYTFVHISFQEALAVQAIVEGTAPPIASLTPSLTLT